MLSKATGARRSGRVTLKWCGQLDRWRGAGVCRAPRAWSCVYDRKMDEPWCLVASEATVPTPVLIRYYGKRWGIEAGFRDIKDMRFGTCLRCTFRARTGGTGCC